jgi:hypothetical protein
MSLSGGHMDNSLILPSIIVGFSYIVLGVLLFFCAKMFLASSERKLSLLEKTTSIASISVDHKHPHEHPEQKKKRIAILTVTMLKELNHPVEEHFTIDSLIDKSMRNIDTESRLTAIHMSEMPTDEMRLQNTPVLGMRQKALLRSGITRSLH